MSLTNFKPQFDNAYQEIFQKVLVAKEIANFRFEPVLSYGGSVERVAYDLSNVRVRTVTRGAASTVDAITDTNELLTVNIEKEAVFHVSDGEVKQAGPLNPGEVIGGQVAIKVAIDFDARVFGEVLNSAYTFDTGDLTTLVSNGTPFSETSTTVPQMVTMMPAKLRRNNIMLSNLCFVTDSMGAALMEQYLLSKNINLAGSVYANGYGGDIRNAQLYVSENLTGTATLALATKPTDGDTVTIGGVTLTFKTALTPAAGEVLIGANVAASNTNLAALINAPSTTTAQGVALSAANQIVFQDTLKLTATAAATSTAIKGIGSGALVLSASLAAGAPDGWTKNCIHAYYGKKGAIDAVMQEMKEVDMRATTDRRGTNVFSSYLAGIKTFTDGSKKFLNVLLAR